MASRPSTAYEVGVSARRSGIRHSAARWASRWDYSQLRSPSTGYVRVLDLSAQARIRICWRQSAAPLPDLAHVVVWNAGDLGEPAVLEHPGRRVRLRESVGDDGGHPGRRRLIQPRGDRASCVTSTLMRGCHAVSDLDRPRGPGRTFEAAEPDDDRRRRVDDELAPPLR